MSEDKAHFSELILQGFYQVWADISLNLQKGRRVYYSFNRGYFVWEHMDQKVVLIAS